MTQIFDKTSKKSEESDGGGREVGDHDEFFNFEAHEDDAAAELGEVVFVRASDAFDEAVHAEAF